MSYLDAYDGTKDSPINPAIGAEQVRQEMQDRMLTEAMGGVLAEQDDLEHVDHILDLACGPGHWALEVARLYADREVMGIDRCPEMVMSGNIAARASSLENAVFAVKDITHPLGIASDSFELINGRLLASCLRPKDWPPLLAECLRVLTPGGILRLSEWEICVSSSPALHRMHRLLYQAFAAQKRTFSVDGQSLGIAHQLGGLLREAGFERVQQRPLLLDGSFGAPLSYSLITTTEVGFTLLKPYLLHLKVIDAPGFEQLYQQMQCEIRGDAFRCVCFGLTIWARKPAPGAGPAEKGRNLEP
jgi:ubiquinone/menaquinone biosynthesis C-methylase UbiE